MRLFGTPGGTLNTARSTYGFMPPFDLALALPVTVIVTAVINFALAFESVQAVSLQFPYVQSQQLVFGQG